MSVELLTESLTRRFGGLVAVNGVDLRVHAGTIHGIIGPNGAGKTSLFNLIAGSLLPSSGRILLGGRDIARLNPEARCALGVARTFQVPRPFTGLDVRENVAMGCLGRARSAAHARALAGEVLERLGIERHAAAMAGSLPIGLRKLLEVARALATAPRLLLLDEVMGGLHGEEVDRMIATLRQVGASGVTIVLIEHVLPAIIALASTVTVLDQGRIIASGTGAEVTRDPAVVAAYLGDEVLGMIAAPLLEVRNLSAFYGDLQALVDVSLEVMPGEIVAIVGANAAGKSTLLRALSSVVRWTGTIRFRGEDLAAVPAHAIVDRGLIQVPEGRELFPFMTVEENLDVGSYSRRARAQAAVTKERVFDLLPRLRERRTQLARTMSGGEQQMCAIGRGLMAQPELLLLDEPSLGLAPIIIRTIYEKLREVNAAGTTVLLVEQNLKAALRIAHRAYVLQQGRVVLAGPSEQLRDDLRVRAAFLGH